VAATGEIITDDNAEAQPALNIVEQKNDPPAEKE
jgi:hypothetical protein